MPPYVTSFTILNVHIQYLGIASLAFFLVSLATALYLIINSFYENFLERIWGGTLLVALIIPSALGCAMASYYISYALLTLLLFIKLVPDKKLNDKGLKVKRGFRQYVLILFLLTIPVITGGIFYLNAINSGQHIPTQEEKVNFAADFALDHSYSIWSTTNNFFRTQNDMLGFFTLGFAGCGELGYVERTMLTSIGVETRRVVTPGENHEFNEVRIGSVWMASDPGYPDLHLCTTEERGAARTIEDRIGGVSFAYADNNSRIWRTSYYSPTDLIVLHISVNGTPIANGSFVLSHQFQNHMHEVDGFYLDNNGTVSFEMGDLQQYSDAGTEKCYWVKVNGIAVGLNITSFGLNQTRIYTFDIGLGTSSLQIDKS